MPHYGRFPYKKLAKYPHISQEDKITWEKFIAINPDAYDSVDYDFALSPVLDAASKAESLGIPGAERIYKYRCDVVGYRDNEIHLIELKKRATPKAIGELVQDYHIYMRDFADNLPVETIIIARESAPEMAFLCAKEDIFLILV